MRLANQVFPAHQASDDVNAAVDAAAKGANQHARKALPAARAE